MLPDKIAVKVDHINELKLLTTGVWWAVLFLDNIIVAMFDSGFEAETYMRACCNPSEFHIAEIVRV